MAKRRMLSIELCTSDKFLDLSEEARQLYFYVNLFADDDGFLGNASTVSRLVGISKRHLEELCEKNYLIRFDNGVYVITHWCLHNQIKKDRYTPTDFIREFKMLELVNKVYVLKEEKETSERSVFFGDILEPQISLDERRSSACTDGNSDDVENLVENSKSRKKEADKGERQESEKESCSTDPQKTNEDERTVSEIRLYFMVKNRANDADSFIEYNEGRQWIGRFGESVKENLRRYVNGWIEMGAAFYGE